MNPPYKIKAVGLLLGLIGGLIPLSDTVAQSYISFETFYQELAPYGTWATNPQYGDVWIPNVRRNFRPYVTRGHWVMTEYGNTWVSDYPWGWAAFHYGRWYLDDYYGWAWVPGHEWGPAWVAWRSGGGYYGWAPLSPGLNVNVSINIGRRIPGYHWAFVRQRYITSPRIYDYCVPRRRIVNVYNHTTIINNTYVYNDQHHYYGGPRVHEIERVTHRRVPVRRVRDSRQPRSTRIRPGSVAIYRPRVRSGQGGRSTSRIAPSTSRSSRDISRVAPARVAPDRVAPDRSSSRTRSSSPRTPAARSSRATDNATRPLYDSQTGVTRSGAARNTNSRSGVTRRGSDPSGVTRSRSVVEPAQRRSSTDAYSPSRSPSDYSRSRSSTRSSSPSRSVSPSRSSTRSNSISRGSSSVGRSPQPSSQSSGASTGSQSSSGSSRSSVSSSSSGQSGSSRSSSSVQRSSSSSSGSSASPSRSSSTGRSRSSRPQQ